MPFQSTLVNIANGELTFWTEGKLFECVSEPTSTKKDGSKVIRKYWVEGLGINNLTGCSNVAWSAAFICFCMRKAGMPLTEFQFSAGHHAYIRASINNTKLNKPNKAYYGRRLAEYKPKPGDLIAQWRKPSSSAPDPNITFDNQPDDFYASHCDIVVSASDTEIVTVGGNVGNRVKKTIFPAINGLLAPKKELICVLECRKP